jgi:hypothetical protein
MRRQFLGIFGAYPSNEIAKHTLRAMDENARRDFYNGAGSPFRYTIEATEKRGAMLENKASLVRHIFDLTLAATVQPLVSKPSAFRPSRRRQSRPTPPPVPAAKMVPSFVRALRAILACLP